MNEINRQVTRAQQRLIMGRFFRILGWTVFVALFIAAIAVAVPKIWYLDIGNDGLLGNWNALWIGGAIGLSILFTGIAAWRNGENRMQAAVEVDSRFRLKERLSSAMTLDDSLAESEVGQALLGDATERVEAIDIRDQFGFKPRWSAMLPLVPAAILIILLFVPNALAAEPVPDKSKTTIDKKEIKVAVENAKKRLKKRAERLTTSGLKDAMEGLKAIDKKIDKISEGSEKEKKEALVKLNDIKKQVADRQNKIGGAKDLKESFSKLAKTAKGPAKKITDAMKAGDFKAAKDAIKDLAEKLKQGKLSETEKKQLAKDIKKLAEQMKGMAKKHDQAKRDLKEKIKQAQQEGDLDKAAKLQKKLDGLKAKDQQNQKMKKMADQLQECSDCMKPGDGGKPKPGENGQQQMKQAGDALDDLAEQMEGLQQELEELKDLEDFQDDLDQIKQNMQGGQCDGPDNDKENWADWANGKGRGGGKRESEEGDTGGYKSKVKGQLKRGQTVVTGSADGANRKGRSTTEARETVKTSMNLDTDPLENEKLPRSLRKHAQQYFENLRKGN